MLRAERSSWSPDNPLAYGGKYREAIDWSAGVPTREWLCIIRLEYAGGDTRATIKIRGAGNTSFTASGETAACLSDRMAIYTSRARSQSKHAE